MTHVMIDLETLSTQYNAVILVIAAIKFEIHEKKEIDHFYERIDINSCKQLGMVECKKTRKWWMNQPKAIRDEAFSGNRSSIFNVLKKFTKWFSGSTYIWSNGSSFDIPILDEAYRRCKLQAPWRFFNIRDVRTLYHLGDIYSNDIPKENMHNALSDCRRQIIGVRLAIENLEKK